MLDTVQEDPMRVLVIEDDRGLQRPPALPASTTRRHCPPALPTTAR